MAVLAAGDCTCKQLHASSCAFVAHVQALSRADIAPALDTLKKKLMERNVAEEIADK